MSINFFFCVCYKQFLSQYNYQHIPEERSQSPFFPVIVYLFIYYFANTVWVIDYYFCDFVLVFLLLVRRLKLFHHLELKVERVMSLFFVRFRLIVGSILHDCVIIKNTKNFKHNLVKIFSIIIYVLTTYSISILFFSFNPLHNSKAKTSLRNLDK